MRKNEEAHASISVRPVGRTWFGAPMLRVLVDDVCVGVLKDKNVATFPISAGPHKLQVRRDFARSTVLDLDLSVGQRAYFEYGVNHAAPWARVRVIRNAFILAVIPAVVISTAIGLPPSWSAGIFFGLFAVAAGIVLWKSFVPAGAYLHLKRVGKSNV
jgi:hypothetical protein